MSYTGIFMASGFSRRMGQNKLLLPFRQKPLFQHGLAATEKSRLDHLLVVTAYPEIQRYCTRQRIPWIENQSPQEGQSVSIRLGVARTAPSHGFVFIPGDQPFLTPEMLNRLLCLGLQDPEKIIIPQYRGRPGSPVLFPKSFRAELLALTGDVGGKQLIRAHPEACRFLALDSPSPLTDIDSPSDYLQAETRTPS